MAANTVIGAMANKITINVVLFAPKMPANTGNIIRLCANTGAQLHLVQPIAFDLGDKKLRRAGLDYHEYATLKVHGDWAAARASLQQQGAVLFAALTTRGERCFFADFSAKILPNWLQSLPSYERDFSDKLPQIALIFGSETDGLPASVREDLGAQNWYRLPMLAHSRSLNLSNAAAVCVYEVWRIAGFGGALSIAHQDRRGH